MPSPDRGDAGAQDGDTNSGCCFTQDGSVDYKGRPANKLRTGGWSPCYFILGNELSERLVYYGVGSNLVTYLSDVLQQGLATASKSVNNWQGTSLLTPILGGFVGDAYLGRYRAIALFGAVYMIGLLMLVMSVTLPGLKSPTCEPTAETCHKATAAQVAFFYCALYVTALGSGGMKPNVSAFGADQFDYGDAKESLRKNSFFNWWYMMIGTGTLLAVTVVIYVQDNVGWSWGFGIPTIVLAICLALFFAGTKLYRYQTQLGSPFTQVARVLVAAARNWNVKPPADPNLLYEIDVGTKSLPPGQRQIPHTKSLRFLDKAAIPTAHTSPWRLCTATEVEEMKLFVNMIPVWVTTLIFAATIGQGATVFTRMGATMDTRLGSHFRIPPASLQVFTTIAILVTIPVYDRVLVPMARRFTGNPRGISMLQRIGFGLLLANVSMVCAAVAETRRLQYVRQHGLQDAPRTMLPLSIFRLVPQYAIMGVADALTIAGLLDFFYDQSPDHMRSVGTAYYLSIAGVGTFLSSAIITVVNESTQPPWIGSNVNRSRLDKFFWMFAIVGTVNLAAFCLVAWRYRYKVTREDTAMRRDGRIDPWVSGIGGSDHLQHGPQSW